MKPPVWRRIEVSSSIKLSDLADVLEAAVGWLGGHLHAFEADSVLYETPDGESFGRRPRDERKVQLVEVLPAVKSKMRWDYDFGDGWEHDVVVEAIEPARAGVTYPVCLTGKRACPPEDCGGPWGYSTFSRRSATRTTRNTRSSPSGWETISIRRTLTRVRPPRTCVRRGHSKGGDSPCSSLCRPIGRRPG